LASKGGHSTQTICISRVCVPTFSCTTQCTSVTFILYISTTYLAYYHGGWSNLSLRAGDRRKTQDAFESLVPGKQSMDRLPRASDRQGCHCLLRGPTDQELAIELCKLMTVLAKFVQAANPVLVFAFPFVRINAPVPLQYLQLGLTIVLVQSIESRT
jgi:hypothetical protein